jgi:hypothetical protein
MIQCAERLPDLPVRWRLVAGRAHDRVPRVVVTRGMGRLVFNPEFRNYSCLSATLRIRTETHELGEEIVASYLYQVHLHHWLETNGYGRFLNDNESDARAAMSCSNKS